MASFSVIVAVGLGLLWLVGCHARPSLASFNLNMNSGMLILHFDTEMTADGGDVTGVTFGTRGSSISGSDVPLEDGCHLSLEADDTLEIVIQQSDLDNIKASSIGHNASVTWIYLTEGAFYGDDGRSSLPVFGKEVYGHKGTHVSTLQKDTIKPQLDHFTVDPETGQLYLFFDEAVKLSSVDVSLMATSLSTNSTGGRNSGIKLDCSGVRYGRDSYRELIVEMDTPCTSYNYNYSVGLYGDVVTSSYEVYTNESTDWERLLKTWQYWDDGSDMPLGDMSLAALPPLLLNLSDGFVTDFAIIGNKLEVVTLLEESEADCQPCHAGEYRDSICTDVYDATCTNCTQSCPADHYIVSECNVGVDLICQQCTPCAWEEYEISGCEGSNDRNCSACTACDANEYEVWTCSRDRDRQCDSCFSCDAPANPACVTESIRAWQLENCCVDREDNPADCRVVAFKDNEITTRNSRRHWNFADNTQPHIDGYTQRRWAPIANVAVLERGMETEAQSERNAFDNPAYRGQGQNVRHDNLPADSAQ